MPGMLADDLLQKHQVDRGRPNELADVMQNELLAAGPEAFMNIVRKDFKVRGFGHSLLLQQLHHTLLARFYHPPFRGAVRHYGRQALNAQPVWRKNERNSGVLNALRE